MTDLHGKIMNIASSSDINVCGEGAERTAYLVGHRDARHEAAELALEADHEIDALRAQLATARADALREVSDRDALEKLLREYRLMRTSDDDGYGYPLIDALTCGHATIKEGEEECHFLADHICGHIRALIDKEPSNGS